MAKKKPATKPGGVFKGPASERTRPPEGSKKVLGIGKQGQGAKKKGTIGQVGGL